jgi:hypothetical protein
MTVRSRRRFLGEVMPKRPTQPAVVLVDALDEAEARHARARPVTRWHRHPHVSAATVTGTSIAWSMRCAAALGPNPARRGAAEQTPRTAHASAEDVCRALGTSARTVGTTRVWLQGV